MLNETTIEYSLLLLAVITVLLPMMGGRFTLPLLTVFGRWLRWGLFATVFAFSLNYFELSFRPYWVHVITGLTLWFVLETGYNWIAIKALSRSELPLFPDFELNKDGDEWPADKKFIELREWLRAENFKRLAAMKAELFEDTYLRASVYESEDQLTRIQILFLPKRKDGATACYSITTQGKEERRLVTDNLFLPYGGYYPSEWEMSRKPLIGSLRRLLKLHHTRLLKSTLTPIKAEDTPLEELNDQQRILERLNLETGFLVPRALQQEEGKITYEGRYRLWKEMWMLAYLGKSMA
ncbi:MAG TPA: hypothetical protein DCX06_03065 [Opitutae bacterium]|nr:hypothetical protein [Opitutae bacterium]